MKEFTDIFQMVNKYPWVIGIFVVIGVIWIRKVDQKVCDIRAIQMKIILMLNDIVIAVPRKMQKDLAHKWADIFKAEIEKSIEREKVEKNPLTPEEANRLDEYYKRFNSKGHFTKREAEDFKALAEKMEADRRNKNAADVGALVLLGIAIILLASFAGKGKK